MGKKNSHIHFLIETSSKEKLEKMASEKGVPLSIFCREKLLESSRLDIIEDLIRRILKKIE